MTNTISIWRSIPMILPCLLYTSIIGDYRRIALYGVDLLIEDKKEQVNSTPIVMSADVIRDREELAEQIRALNDLKKLAEIYGCDISRPASNTKEAIQAIYFGYLAAVKEQNGAAMSLEMGIRDRSRRNLFFRTILR